MIGDRRSSVQENQNRPINHSIPIYEQERSLERQKDTGDPEKLRQLEAEVKVMCEADPVFAAKRKVSEQVIEKCREVLQRLADSEQLPHRCLPCSGATPQGLKPSLCGRFSARLEVVPFYKADL
jgi:hypothetical protein